MRIGRPTPPVILTVDELLTLGQWTRRPKTAQALAQLDCTSRSSRTKDPLTPRRETPKVPLASHEDRPFAAPHG